MRAMETSCRAWCDMDCPWDGTGTTVVTLRGEEDVWRKRRVNGRGKGKKCELMKGGGEGKGRSKRVKEGQGWEGNRRE